MSRRPPSSFLPPFLLLRQKPKPSLVIPKGVFPPLLFLHCNWSHIVLDIFGDTPKYISYKSCRPAPAALKKTTTLLHHHTCFLPLVVIVMAISPLLLLGSLETISHVYGRCVVGFGRLSCMCHHRLIYSTVLLPPPLPSPRLIIRADKMERFRLHGHLL